MKVRIGRLDKIVQNNVEFSQNKNIEEQKLYILQDISETLAMIYDKLTENEAVDEAIIIPLDKLIQQKELFFDAPELTEPYPVTFVDYSYAQNEFDPLGTTRPVVNLIAFGEPMTMKVSQYYKRWRCWNKMPTEEQRDREEWKS